LLSAAGDHRERLQAIVDEVRDVASAGLAAAWPDAANE
jgi:hypothetical protein